MMAQTEHNSEEIEIRDESRSLTEIAKTLGGKSAIRRSRGD